MTNQPKVLGTSNENRVVKKARAKGLPAKRQPLSGVLKEYPSDVTIGEEVLVECKVRSTRLNAAGKKVVTTEIAWLDKVTKHAADNSFDLGVVEVQPKGSTTQYVFLRLDDFFDVLTRAYPNIIRTEALEEVKKD